jgi:hypothetical protein
MRLDRNRLLGLLLALLCAAWLAPVPAQAQIAFRSATSAIGPATGTIAFRAATSAAGGNITFRAAATSGTPTTLSPVFRQVASATAASGVLTLAINLPAGTLQNDVMIAAIAVRPSSATITAPAGWALVRRTDNPGPTDSNSLAVYYRVAGGNEPLNYAWTFSASTGAAGGIQAFSSVDTTNPIDVENGQTTPSANTHATPSVTTTVANTMLVTSHTFSSSRTWTPPGGMTESFDVRSVAGNNNAGQSMEGNRQVQAAAGATGIKTANAGGNADAGNTHILALRPALRIPVPAGVAPNDLLLAAVAVAPDTAVITPPAGWTLVRRTDNGAATANSLAVYRRFAGTTEPTSYVFGVSGGTAWVGGMQAYSGVDLTNPIDVENGAATPAALAHATPSVTTTVANTMVVINHTMNGQATWTLPAAGGCTPAFTESFDVTTGGAAAGQSLQGARALCAVAGATGTKTATASANADTGNAHILALRPSAQLINVARPGTAVQNDLMIAAIGFAPDTAVITPPAGWTLVRRIDNSAGPGTNNSLAVYRKVHAVTEPTSYAWTFSANVTVVGGIQAYSGVDIANPIDLENGVATPSALTHTAPSITTTVANAMVVTNHTMNGAANWAFPVAGGCTPVFTESFDVNTGGGVAGQALEGARALCAVAGATGAKTATASANPDKGNAHILALRPLPTTQFDILTPPGTLANDVLITAIAFTPETAVINPTVPADWTLIRRINQGGGGGTNSSLAVFRRLATAGEPAAHGWTFGAAPTAVAGGMQGFSGVDTVTPVNIENGRNSNSALTHATPSVVTTVANTMLVTAHMYASSGTWTPPTGMAESYDRANLATPNAAGVSVEGSRVEQAAIGATGVKTATAVGNADKGNTHIVALRPAPSVAPSPPSFFNACQSATCVPTAAPFTYAALYTKRAGTGFTLHGVALKADGTLESGFAGSVAVDLLANANTGVALGADNCPTSQDATISAGNAIFATGRAVIGVINVGNAYRDVRMRFTCLAGVCGSAITRCSSDNFAIRPSAFTVSSSANADATGTDVNATPVVKAGATFTLTATALANYNLAPGIDSSKLAAHAGAIQDGSLGGSFSAAAPLTGVASGNFNYSEVGYFNFAANGVYEDSFTAVDQPNDCTDDFSNTLDVNGKYGCKFGNTSATSYFGRFVPDHFALTTGTLIDRADINTGVTETTCPSLFTYMGEDIKTDFILIAENSAAATTLNYTGGHAKFGLTTYGNFGFTGSSGTLGVGSAVPSGVWGSTVGTYGKADVTATHKVTRSPVSPYTNFSVSAVPSYTDGTATIALAASTVVHTGTSEQRYGRLRLQGAYGSELLPLRVPVRAEYFNGTTWTLNTDDSCTAIPQNSVAVGGGISGNLCFLSNPPPTAPTNASCLAGGSPALRLASGLGNWTVFDKTPVQVGFADLALNLAGSGPAGKDASCIPWVAQPASSSAALPWLQFPWCAGKLDPNARIKFGSPKAPYIYLRERY